MTSDSSGLGSSLIRLCCLLVALGIGAVAQAQTLQIAVSNLSNQTSGEGQNNNVIYGVTATPQTGLPPALSLSVLPINSAAYGGFSTLVYAPSVQPGASVDLIAVQTYSAGTIWRFFGPTFSGTSGPPAPPDAVQIWSCGDGCSGPQFPISMAIDGNGTLYVLSSDSISESTVVELWAFPSSSANASGFVANPILVNPDVAGPGVYWSSGAPVHKARDYTLNNIDASNGTFGELCGGTCPPDYPSPSLVMDLMIAPRGVAAPVSANDVLVLFGDHAFAQSDPVALVADYSATNLQAVLSYSGLNPPWSILATPLTVANANDFGDWGEVFIEGEPQSATGGEGAVSIAAWPATSNILLMTGLGNIYQFSWSSTDDGTSYNVSNPANFSQGVLPLGCANGSSQVATLRTGVEATNSYAFVTQYTCGEGGASRPSQVWSMDGTSTQIVMENDGPLVGLAVSGGTGTGAGCTGSGCNLTGGVQQVIKGTPAAIKAIQDLGSAGTIVENVCIVEQDPRQICNKNAPLLKMGNKLYNSPTLPVTSVCPNSHFNPSFGNTVIPDYICGNYGPLGAGTGTGFVVIQGIAKGVDGIPGLLDYSDADPDEFFGTTAQPCSTTNPADILFGWAPWSGDTNVEGTIPEGPNMIELTYGCGSSRGSSSGMSLILVGGALNLHGVTEFKPNNLVSFAEFKYGNLLEDMAQAPIDKVQKLRLVQIITESEEFLIKGKSQCAARKLWRADKYVADHARHFHGKLGQDPNPYGRARSRLANLFFTIYSRIEGYPPPSVWPLSRPPGMCVNNEDDDHDGY